MGPVVRGVPLPTGGWGPGARVVPCPLPRKFLTFLSRNSVIWCILGCFLKFIFQSLRAIFVTVRATGMTEHG